MAGGRPHESHDLTFAWVARARARARARSRVSLSLYRESRSRCDFCAPRRRERSEESNFKCNGHVAPPPMCRTDLSARARARELRTFAFSLLPPASPPSALSRRSLIAFSLSTTCINLSVFSRGSTVAFFGVPNSLPHSNFTPTSVIYSHRHIHLQRQTACPLKGWSQHSVREGNREQDIPLVCAGVNFSI